jgi:hypothetical protein
MLPSHTAAGAWLRAGRGAGTTGAAAGRLLAGGCARAGGRCVAERYAEAGPASGLCAASGGPQRQRLPPPAPQVGGGRARGHMHGPCCCCVLGGLLGCCLLLCSHGQSGACGASLVLGVRPDSCAGAVWSEVPAAGLLHGGPRRQQQQQQQQQARVIMHTWRLSVPCRPTSLQVWSLFHAAPAAPLPHRLQPRSTAKNTATTSELAVG